MILLNFLSYRAFTMSIRLKKMEGKANKLLKINNDDRGNSAQRIKSPYQTSVAYEK